MSKKISLELEPCCGKRSGVGTYTYELARRLKNTDEISFQGNIYNFRNRHDYSDIIKNIKFDVCQETKIPYGIYRRIWQVAPFAYESLFDKADITHFFNFVVPPKITGKIITTIYDMSFVRYPETLKNSNLRKLQEGIKRSVDQSDIVVTISEFSKSEICNILKVERDKVRIVPCAVSLSEKMANFKQIQDKWRIDSPYILYVGNIEPRKNLSNLIKAFEKVRNNLGDRYMLVLAGASGWKAEDIYRTAEDSKYSEDIIFTGYVSEEEKAALYQNASLFAYVSLYEGFGIPPLEAMRYGVPVVCSGTSSLPEVVGDGACLVKPMDVDEIATGIIKTLTDNEYSDELRKKGNKRVQKFSWDESADKLFELYQEM